MVTGIAGRANPLCTRRILTGSRLLIIFVVVLSKEKKLHAVQNYDRICHLACKMTKRCTLNLSQDNWFNDRLNSQLACYLPEDAWLGSGLKKRLISCCFPLLDITRLTSLGKVILHWELLAVVQLTSKLDSTIDYSNSSSFKKDSLQQFSHLYNTSYAKLST